MRCRKHRDVIITKNRFADSENLHKEILPKDRLVVPLCLRPRGNAIEIVVLVLVLIDREGALVVFRGQRRGRVHNVIVGSLCAAGSLSKYGKGLDPIDDPLLLRDRKVLGEFVPEQKLRVAHHLIVTVNHNRYQFVLRRNDVFNSEKHQASSGSTITSPVLLSMNHARPTSGFVCAEAAAVSTLTASAAPWTAGDVRLVCPVVHT